MANVPQTKTYAPTGGQQIWRFLFDSERFEVKMIISADESGQAYATFESDPNVTPRYSEVLKISNDAVADGYARLLAGRINARYGLEQVNSGIAADGKRFSTFRLPGVNVSGLPEGETGVTFPFTEHPALNAINNIFVDVTNAVSTVGMEAVMDLPKLGPQTDLMTTLESSAAMFDSGQKAMLNFSTPYAAYPEVLRQNPAMYAQITNELESRGITSFRYLSNGRSGIFLETNTGEVLAIRSGVFRGVTRPQLPQQLQPLYQFQVNGLNIEVLPQLDTTRVTPEHLATLKDSIAQMPLAPNGEEYYIDDAALRNIGLDARGTPYYLDGDGMATRPVSDPGKPRGTADLSPWVNPDGSWRQYTDNAQRYAEFGGPVINGQPLDETLGTPRSMRVVHGTTTRFDTVDSAFMFAESGTDQYGSGFYTTLNVGEALDSYTNPTSSYNSSRAISDGKTWLQEIDLPFGPEATLKLAEPVPPQQQAQVRAALAARGASLDDAAFAGNGETLRNALADKLGKRGQVELLQEAGFRGMVSSEDYVVVFDPKDVQIVRTVPFINGQPLDEALRSRLIAEREGPDGDRIRQLEYEMDGDARSIAANQQSIDTRTALTDRIAALAPEGDSPRVGSREEAQAIADRYKTEMDFASADDARTLLAQPDIAATLDDYVFSDAEAALKQSGKVLPSDRALLLEAMLQHPGAAADLPAMASIAQTELTRALDGGATLDADTAARWQRVLKGVNANYEATIAETRSRTAAQQAEIATLRTKIDQHLATLPPLDLSDPEIVRREASRVFGEGVMDRMDPKDMAFLQEQLTRPAVPGGNDGPVVNDCGLEEGPLKGALRSTTAPEVPLVGLGLGFGTGDATPAVRAGNTDAVGGPAVIDSTPPTRGTRMSGAVDGILPPGQRGPEMSRGNVVTDGALALKPQAVPQTQSYNQMVGRAEPSVVVPTAANDPVPVYQANAGPGQAPVAANDTTVSAPAEPRAAAPTEGAPRSNMRAAAAAAAPAVLAAVVAPVAANAGEPRAPKPEAHGQLEGRFARGATIATAAVNAVAAANALRKGDMKEAAQYAGVTLQTVTMEAAQHKEVWMGAAHIAERIGIRGALAGTKAITGKIPVVGAVVGVAVGLGEIGFEAWQMAHGKSNWQKLAGTTASAVAGVAGGIIGFGAGEALQEGIHTGTEMLWGKENAARHSGTVEVALLAGELIGEATGKPQKKLEFNLLDTNFDGKVDMNDAKTAAMLVNPVGALALGAQAAGKYIPGADVNHDGKVDAKDVGQAAARVTRDAGKAVTRAAAGAVRAAYNAADLNHDGKVDAKDAAAGVKRVFNAADKNHDGKVDAGEAAMAAARAAGAALNAGGVVAANIASGIGSLFGHKPHQQGPHR